MGDKTKIQWDDKTVPSKADYYRHHIQSGQDSEFLCSLCDALDVAVSILDEDLNYKFISHATFTNLRIKPGDLSVGDSLSKCHDLMMESGLLTPQLLTENKLSAERQLALSKSAGETEPSIVKLGDGTTYKFIRKTLPNGHTVSMSTDISELVEKDHLLNEALALGDAGYWMYDIASKTYELSPTLESTLTAEDKDRINKEGIFTVVHPEDLPVAEAALKNAKHNDDRFEYTVRILIRSGDYLWGSTRGDILRDKEGNPTKIRAFVKNVTRERYQAKELERAKDEAIAASHAKSQFLANMSHEIRTPMNGILGMAELLANSDINERQRDFVNVINNSASALLTIINDILDFSKIEAGAFELDPMPFDLKSTVIDVASMLTSNASEKNLELIINYPADFERNFIGDAGRLRQVMTNLIGNAIKFTEIGHIITDVGVSPARNGVSFVTISVTDTGIGIDPEKLDHVFNKFTQGDGSTTRLYGGTGLGLSITKAIVEMMDGRISVRSELGKGSTFTAQIPMKVDVNAVEKTFDTTTLAGKRALIVDDINVNRQLLQEQLASWDIEAEAVEDGLKALSQLKTSATNGEDYDLIITDYLMPGMNGKELATIISETDELAHIPIIMLSSCDQPISSKKMKDIGIENYLIKPAREARLYDAIIKTINEPRKTTPKPKEVSQAAPVAGQAPIVKTEILVAEDFPLNRDVVKLMLSDSPYKPVFAVNGEEAVNLYKKAPDRFPIIVMDISMPVMDGHEATRLIQAFEQENGITPKPIIALTGHALKNDREECLKAGMCDYLSKPVKQLDLLDKLNHWLSEDKNSSAAVA